MAWIRTVDQETATGALKDECAKAIDRAGRLFNVVQIMGLNPSHLRGSMDLYLSLMPGTSELTRAQHEIMAVVVSIANRCHLPTFRNSFHQRCQRTNKTVATVTRATVMALPNNNQVVRRND